MRTPPTVFLILSLAVSLGHAQTPDARARAVDALFDAWVTPSSPGAAVAVVQDGEIVYAQGYGLATLEHAVPITPESVFYLGSVSKQFVAMAIALLDQDGVLSLDDDIRRWVPEIPDYGTPITVRHLVHHTSGIRDYLGLMNLAGLELGHFHSNEGVIELIARQKVLNFEPGAQYLYSNSGYFLLAVIVERAGGRSLREFAHDRIFQPLGMDDSHFHDRYTHVIPNRAFAYLPAGEGGYRQFLTSFDRVGSGGVFSTVGDLFRWDQNFYHHEVGGADLVARLHTQGTLNSGERIAYAFGLSIGKYRGLETVSHGGSLGGYRAFFTRFPAQRFTVIVLANVSNVPGQLAERIADIYLADHLAEGTGDGVPTAGTDTTEFVNVPRGELERVSGHYWNAPENYLRRVYVKDGTLVYHRSVRDESELRPLGDDRFVMMDVPVHVEVRFLPAGVEKPRQMIVTVDGGTPVVLEAFAPIILSQEELETFAGTYYSDELDVEYEVEATTFGISAGSRRAGTVVFAPLFADTFRNAVFGTMLRFHRNEQGAIAGFALDAGRVRNVGFARRNGGTAVRR